MEQPKCLTNCNSEITDYIQSIRKEYEDAAKSLWIGMIDILERRGLEGSKENLIYTYINELKTLGVIK